MATLVGKQAPDFNATAVVKGEEFEEDFTLSQFRGRNYVVLFFWPKDFTFVCPTEIIAFQERKKDFEQLGVQLIGVSTDSEFTHYAWLNTPQDDGGIKGVEYPLVADLDKTISHNYGVLAGEYDYEVDENEQERLVFKGEAVAYRGLFLIDKDGVVQHELVNNMPLGRNVDEALRVVKALQHVEQKGEVCPANWDEGKDAMVASTEGVASYLSSHHK